MDIALSEARAALVHSDVPVGAVVVLGDRVLAARHNEREHLNDPTAHAEVLALRDAAGGRGVVAPRRLHAGGHPRAVRDVRRRAASTRGSAASCSAPPTSRPAARVALQRVRRSPAQPQSRRSPTGVRGASAATLLDRVLRQPAVAKAPC